MDLSTPVTQLRFIGPTYAKRLENLGIITIRDLLYHFPFRYEDLSVVQKISATQMGETATIKGSIWQIKNVRTRSGKFLTQAIVNDGTGSIDIVWFNQPFLTKTLKTGMVANFSGKIQDFNYKPAMVSPEYEVEKPGGESIHTGRLVPIYPETYGVSSKWLRSRIKPLLDTYASQLKDVLPPEIMRSHQFLPTKVALVKIHFPISLEEADQIRHQLAFEEMFIVQLRSEIQKQQWQQQRVGLVFRIDDQKITKFIQALPFELTGAQKKVVAEIITDLQKSSPMNRLIEGDVGSGKTVVAAIACYISFLNGFKTAFMAPTEILATQHFHTLNKMLENTGLKIILQTGSKKMAHKVSDYDVIVGTHALLTEKLALENLGLIVIDEQHRFGVEQRAFLRSKGDPAHVLTMTATPIPRTLALTLFGDLELSVIDEMPKGRKMIKTYVVPPEKRDSAYDFIRDHIQQGEQVFIIAPFIEPSESLSTVKAVNTEFHRLSEEIFPDLKIGLLHGKLKAKEKDAVLDDFRAGKYHILVSTPVVEVGIDIPNATIMLIEGSDRFGLAQLHQLRGRVGRGEAESFCLLFTDNPNPEAIRRLRILEKYQIGMQVAEADYRSRGPGDIYGTMQSGIPHLKVAQFSDIDLIDTTHKDAALFLKEANLDAYPLLQQELLKLNQKIAPD